jgi:hypothetical protein
MEVFQKALRKMRRKIQVSRPALQPLGLTDRTWTDLVQGIEIHEHFIAQPRDPDALPPRNTFELIAGHIQSGCASLLRGNALYAIKAGLLTGASLMFCADAIPILPILVALCIPSFLKSTSGYAYSTSVLLMVLKCINGVVNRT